MNFITVVLMVAAVVLSINPGTVKETREALEKNAVQSGLVKVMLTDAAKELRERHTPPQG